MADDGRVDRGRASRAAPACEPVAGARCVALRLWWKGRADLVNPYVVLAAFALGGRVLRSGRLERAVNYGVVLGLVSAAAVWRFSMKVGKTLDDLLVDDQEAQ